MRGTPLVVPGCSTAAPHRSVSYNTCRSRTPRVYSRRRRRGLYGIAVLVLVPERVAILGVLRGVQNYRVGDRAAVKAPSSATLSLSDYDTTVVRCRRRVCGTRTCYDNILSYEKKCLILAETGA